MHYQKLILFGIILTASSMNIFALHCTGVEFTGFVNDFSPFGYYLGDILSAILSILFLKYLFFYQIKFIDKPYILFIHAILFLLLLFLNTYAAVKLGEFMGEKGIDVNTLSLQKNIRGQVYGILFFLIFILYRWIFAFKRTNE